jgi:hypothetical protein
VIGNLEINHYGFPTQRHGSTSETWRARGTGFAPRSSCLIGRGQVLFQQPASARVVHRLSVLKLDWPSAVGARREGGQYSLASITVITRSVTVGSLGSGE